MVTLTDEATAWWGDIQGMRDELLAFQQNLPAENSPSVAFTGSLVRMITQQREQAQAALQQLQTLEASGDTDRAAEAHAIVRQCHREAQQIYAGKMGVVHEAPNTQQQALVELRELYRWATFARPQEEPPSSYQSIRQLGDSIVTDIDQVVEWCREAEQLPSSLDVNGWTTMKTFVAQARRIRERVEGSLAQYQVLQDEAQVVQTLARQSEQTCGRRMQEVESMPNSTARSDYQTALTTWQTLCAVNRTPPPYPGDHRVQIEQLATEIMSSTTRMLRALQV